MAYGSDIDDVKCVSLCSGMSTSGGGNFMDPYIGQSRYHELRHNASGMCNGAADCTCDIYPSSLILLVNFEFKLSRQRSKTVRNRNENCLPASSDLPK